MNLLEKVIELVESDCIIPEDYAVDAAECAVTAVRELLREVDPIEVALSGLGAIYSILGVAP